MEGFNPNYHHTTTPLLFIIAHWNKVIDSIDVIKLLLQHPKINIHITFECSNHKEMNIYQHCLQPEHCYNVRLLHISDSVHLLQIHAYIDYVIPLIQMNRTDPSRIDRGLIGGKLSCYVIMWILDWVPDFEFAKIDDSKKIRIIENIYKIYSNRR